MTLTFWCSCVALAAIFGVTFLSPGSLRELRGFQKILIGLWTAVAGCFAVAIFPIPAVFYPAALVMLWAVFQMVLGGRHIA